MTFTEAFAEYGAKPVNPQWSMCAFAADGSLVVSLWQTWLKKGATARSLVYDDKLSDWLGNSHGRNEFQRNLGLAQAAGVPLRIIVAHPSSLDEAAKVGMLADESEIKKDFFVRKDWIGSIEYFDGDRCTILIRPA